VGARVKGKVCEGNTGKTLANTVERERDGQRVQAGREETGGLDVQSAKTAEWVNEGIPTTEASRPRLGNQHLAIDRRIEIAPPPRMRTRREKLTGKTLKTREQGGDVSTKGENKGSNTDVGANVEKNIGKAL